MKKPIKKKPINILIAESDTIKISSTEYVNMFSGWNCTSEKYFVQMRYITPDGEQIGYEEYKEVEDCKTEYTFYKNILEFSFEND